jgi:hypothetical protein
MDKDTGTIFKVYLLDKSAAHKEEGFVQLWKHKGKLQKRKYLAFDSLSEIPQKMRDNLISAAIEWPKKSK